jgi:hypothetical protein
MLMEGHHTILVGTGTIVAVHGARSGVWYLWCVQVVATTASIQK